MWTPLKSVPQIHLFRSKREDSEDLLSFSAPSLSESAGGEVFVGDHGDAVPYHSSAGHHLILRLIDGLSCYY